MITVPFWRMRAAAFSVLVGVIYAILVAIPGTISESWMYELPALIPVAILWHLSDEWLQARKHAADS